MAKFKFENLKFQQIMKDYATIREKTIPESVHLNARLLCVEFARRTQPFGFDENIGKERVRKDISNIIKPPVYFRKFLSKTVSQRLKKRLEKLYSAQNWSGISSTLAAVNLGPDSFVIAASGDMNGIHRDNRSQRTGRAFNRPRKYYQASDSTALYNYIETKQKLVGLAKSGWAECATQLRKVVTGSMTRGIPSWVTKHKKGFGSVVDRTFNPSTPTVTITNSLPWADSVLRTGEQLNGMSIVAQKMKKQMEMILKKRQLVLKEAA